MKKRIISFVLALVMVFCASTSMVSAAIHEEGLVPSGVEYRLDPQSNQYLPVRNIEAAISARSRSADRYNDGLEAFLAQRRLGHEANTDQDTSLQSETSTPTPSGVGYGAYFTESFRKDFETGTELSYDIICPSTAGGDVNDFLYLTSTNRAAKGVEAFISYYKQGNPYFKVFDWARPESGYWQVSMSYDELADYLTSKTIGGITYPCITVHNCTMQIYTNIWSNIVYLKNYTTNTLDQVYAYTYYATLQDQLVPPEGTQLGEWGPIVETFQSSYNQPTNAIGFANTFLRSKTSSYESHNWEDWNYLRNSFSTIRKDTNDFKLLYNMPNYTFIVH